MRIGSILLVFLLAVGGCAPTFQYNGVSYTTRDAAVAAVRAKQSRNLNNVPEASSHLSGSLLIGIPTRQIIRQHGVTATDNAGDEMTGYIVDVLELGYLGVADIVKKGKVFDQVTVVRADDPEGIPAAGYDFKLWLLGADQYRWQWYLSKTGAGEKEPVTFNQGLAGSQRDASFNVSLFKAAKILGATGFAQPTPANPNKPSSAGEATVLSTGTGFFINSDGFAVSNAHVVDGCSVIRVVLQDGKVAPAATVATDSENDLALIKVGERGPGYGRLRIGWPVRQGEQIVLYGYPLAGVLASKGNLSTGIVSALAGVLDDSRKLQITAPVQPGNSGGPVLDQNGNVIGVVASKLNSVKVAKVTGDIPQNVNFAIKSGVLFNFLEANGIGFTVATAKRPLPLADIGDRAKAFTFMIECR